MPYFLTFKEISKKQLSPGLIGGKASALVRLYQEGFPVPDGFVITTEFFNNFSQENPSLKFSKQEIATIYRYIDACSPSNSVAVRSSASVEDSNSQSFAGQFDSFLNIKKEFVLEAVEKCWRSLYNARSQAYAKTQNDNRKMAVLIQNMVSLEISGVAFSVHPVIGNKDVIVIEAVLGSNELLVRGTVTPNCYIVSKSLKIIDKQIVSQSRISQQNLSDQQLLNIAKLVNEVSRLFKTEVDIEWAIENDNFYILQSRPVTAIQFQNVK